MASATIHEFTADQPVNEFLRQRGVDPEFRTVCNLVRECFPGLIGLDARLQDDPDEDGRSQVVVCAKLPDSYPDNLLQAGLRRYHDRLVAEIPLASCPLFALITEFEPE